MRKTLVMLFMASLMLLYPVNSVLVETAGPMESTTHDVDWSHSEVVRSDLNLSDDDKPVMVRPDVVFNNINSLPIAKTGAASVAIPEKGEFWMIGGREDPNPSQNGDEMETNMVDTLDINTGIWVNADAMLEPQQYAGADRIGDLILVAGDWWPTNSNPTKNPGGMLQIHNLTNSTWFEGEVMPENRAVGNAGVASLGGYLYVAGGDKGYQGRNPTNQTLRYDPIDDEWDIMANMSTPRWGLTLTAHDGLLYAMGGAVKTSSSWWIPPTHLNTVEVYNPANDTWWTLPNMSRSVFGHVTLEYNDELVVFGGHTGSANQKSWGYDPDTGIWRKLSDLPSGMWDLTGAVYNNSIIAGSGDTSNYLYSSWGTTFSNNIFQSMNLSSMEGWLSSRVHDLRPGTEFTCRPIVLNISAELPAKTSITTQIKTHILANSLTSTIWNGPDGSINSWYQTEDSIITSEDANFLQYRLVMKTEDLENWTTPTLDNVSIESDHVGFHVPPPNTVHALSEPFIIQTGHHLTNGSANDEMWISTLDGTDVATFRHTPSTGQYSLSDDAGMIESWSATTIQDDDEDRRIEWNIVLADGISGDSLRFGARSLHHDGSSLDHLIDEAVDLDSNLEVAVIESYAEKDGTSFNMPEGSVIPPGSELQVEVLAFFPTTSNNHSGKDVESRLNLQLINTTADGAITWWNHTTQWQELANSRELVHTLPLELEGDLSITVESRSPVAYNITSGHDVFTVVVDGSNPILHSSNPSQGAYIDSEENRSVSLSIWEPGGLDIENLTIMTWVQAMHDGTDGTVPDEQVQSSEMNETSFTHESEGGFWLLNFTLDDSSNPDHGLVAVHIFGGDLLGNPFLSIDDGTLLTWETRDARNAVIESVAVNGTVEDGRGLRMEPGISAGWVIEFSDDNSVQDIQIVELHMGGSDELGIRWLSDGGGCSALDERIISDSISCVATYTEDRLFLDISFAPTWRLNPDILQIGALQIVATDIDGIATFDIGNQEWFLTTDLIISEFSIKDSTGPVQGEIADGVFIALGDVITVSAYIEHGSSGSPMDGLVTVRWSGTIMGEDWSGEQTVELVNGTLESQIIPPHRSGVAQVSISILDEMGWQELSASPEYSLTFDDQDPLLLEPAAHIPPSRYHLKQVVVTAGIRDDVDFTSNATAYCQIRGNGMDWPIISNEAPPVGILDDRSVYSFEFNFSGLGRAADLPSDATLACWVEGADSSGRQIVPEGDGNSEDKPWLSLALSSEGPNLKMTSFTSDLESAEMGGRFRVFVQVDNIGEDIDEPLVMRIDMVSPNGETIQGWVENRPKGLVAGGQWTTTIDLWPDSTGAWTLVASIDPDDKVSELNEDDNQKEIKVEVVAKPEGFLSRMAEPAAYGGIAIAVLIVGVVILRRVLVKDEEFIEEVVEEARETPAITGPPPASAARPRPVDVPMDAVVEVPPSALAALDGLAPVKQESGIPPIGSSVSDWEGLKWPGEYVYEADGTWFSGPECGRWKQAEDGSFTRMS